MTIANIGNQVYGFSQTVYNAGVQTANSCGKAFTALSKEAADTDVVLIFAKAADAFINAKEVFGFGSANAVEIAFQGQVNNLDGWKSLMTLPSEVKDTVLKVRDLIASGSYSLIADCVSAVAGLFNASYDAISFLENQFAVPAFKGVSAMAESANFQALAVGAAARTAVSAEKVISYFSGKEADLGRLVGNALDLTKNAGDTALAALKLTNGSEVALTIASSVSAASKVAKYCFSKVA